MAQSGSPMFEANQFIFDGTLFYEMTKLTRPEVLRKEVGV